MTDVVTILVVEDEALIEQLVVAGLEDAGFVVAVARTADEAIGMLGDDAAVYRAVVTDVNFASGPKTGWDVARHAREQKTDLPIVYMTGASAHEWTSRGVPASVLVAKPFVIGQIVTAISHLLNATPSLVEPDRAGD